MKIQKYNNMKIQKLKGQQAATEILLDKNIKIQKYKKKQLQVTMFFFSALRQAKMFWSTIMWCMKKMGFSWLKDIAIVLWKKDVTIHYPSFFYLARCQWPHHWIIFSFLPRHPPIEGPNWVFAILLKRSTLEPLPLQQQYL